MTEVEKMLKVLADAADDKKAEDLVILNLKGLSIVADYFIICHGNSDTQVRSIVDHVKEEASKHQMNWSHVEGYTEGRWSLIDFGDIIVHVFHREEREFYNLERIWADAPRIEL
ncbi:ribosome silencing factor [Rubeoparvulum massiliense]|uniref:ribosome silencing factor n=1 Tax=Rubeoparvulum massiliense TaxID=1631346 RepID=UPI00065DE865|nr:ribosome silencing factor [Rubeoparvulum massiliense]